MESLVVSTDSGEVWSTKKADAAGLGEVWSTKKVDAADAGGSMVDKWIKVDFFYVAFFLFELESGGELFTHDVTQIGDRR
jgi:hypothetical protein